MRAWIDDDEYHAIGRVDGPDLVGVAGVSTTEVLHHEPVAWLVDLVVEESRRGEGHGTALVEYVESWAAERDCEYVALASPRAKTGVHDFYEDRGFERWGYVIEKGVDPVTD